MPLLFKCSLSEKFLNKTQMPLWVKINKLNDNFKIKFSLIPTLFHWRNHEDHWVAWSLKYFQIQIFTNRNIFFGKSFYSLSTKLQKFKIPINFTQSITQESYILIIITFQKFRILGCYKEYLKVLAAELSIQPHLEINYLQQSDQ